MELSAVLVEQGQVGWAPNNSIAADPIQLWEGVSPNQLTQIILATNYQIGQV